MGMEAPESETSPHLRNSVGQRPRRIHECDTLKNALTWAHMPKAPMMSTRGVGKKGPKFARCLPRNGQVRPTEPGFRQPTGTSKSGSVASNNARGADSRPNPSSKRPIPGRVSSDGLWAHSSRRADWSPSSWGATSQRAGAAEAHVTSGRATVRSCTACIIVPIRFVPTRGRCSTRLISSAPLCVRPSFAWLQQNLWQV